MRNALDRLAHAAAVTFLVLYAPAATAADDRNVQVLPAVTKIAASIAELRELCRGSGQYDACTRIVAYRLEASCTADRGEWRMDATARFLPLVILKNVRKLTHETEHIEDIRRAADRHVGGLESVRFASQAACEARSLSEKAAFETHLGGFALASNLERHPQLRMVASR